MFTSKFTKGVIILLCVFLFVRWYRNSSAESFQEQHKRIVFVFADWCGHCTRFKPTWQKIEDFSKKTRKFNAEALNVDNEENADFINKFQINSFPTIMLFSKNEYKKYDGERDYQLIIDAIEDF